ncbi:designed dimeric coiled coil peptide peptide [Caudoviricetes sp.]|nr:designed dimeric coiled coil peptide peptide [Caudoviricetes sp.]
MKKLDILPPEAAQNAKFRIVFERLEDYREGDIVTGSMLRETGYYQRNGMIEQVPDETPVSTDETRRAAAAVGPEQIAAAIAAHEAERELIAGILGMIDGVAVPDPQDDESSFVQAVRKYRDAIEGSRQKWAEGLAAFEELANCFGLKNEDGTTLDDVIRRGHELVKLETDAAAITEVATKLGDAFGLSGAFSAVEVVNRGLELVDLVKRTDEAKAEGEKILGALRKENADLNKEVEKLKKELEKASKPAKSKQAPPTSDDAA